ncbi:MAG: alpha-amylase [Cyclobacteriaceae bacterium]|nr:alpha-amylase [Cyclobacteriaceae bacterium]
MKKFYTFTLAICLLVSCQTSEPKKDAWPNGVNYEIFVLAFADGNGDGKGDLKGLTARLDYLQDLGVGGVWLMPIMPSPSYHKYDVTDYKGIHPDYGTVEDFKKFVEEAHKRNIQVIIDMIMNHTGSDHPWFQEAIKGKGNPYRDYYVWANKDSISEAISKKEISLDSDNIQQWHPVGDDEKGEHYYGYFIGGMPDLNFDNPKVKDEFIDIGKFWLNEMGVDGFRLDAAKHIFPTDRATDNHAFWIWFREEMTKIKPDVYLVGEVWSKAEEVAPYLKGLPALFNFDMGYAITSVVQQGKDTIDLVKRYKDINDYYRSITPDYVDATFLKNHDQNRILSELDDNEQKARVAASILFTLPGTPYIYYGEEIGMKGKKPDEYIREPFIWDEDGKDPMQTKWEEPKYSTSATVKPLSLQKNDPLSLMNYYKRWIAYRNGSDVMTIGTLSPSPFKITEVVSMIRSLGESKRLALHNISDVEVTVSLAEAGEFSAVEFSTAEGIVIADNAIKIPAHHSVVLTNSK